MKSFFKLLIILSLSVLFLSSCGSNQNNSSPVTEEIETNASQTSLEASDVLDETSEIDPLDQANEETSDQTNEGSFLQESTDDYDYNALTGLPQDKGSLSTRPLVIMFDNQYSARPQAGLIEADVAYEILAEGLITRYMGVFYGSMPDHVGPIRSARPYFIQKALEFNPFYVHVGGSMQALSDIKRYKMADIDGLSSGAFHRESHKKIPHNMYSSSQTLVNDGINRGYYSDVDVAFLPFNLTFTDLENDLQALEIKFTYKAPTTSDSVGYYTSYLYDEESMRYMRFTNGNPHVDEDTGDQLSAVNILVQYTSHKVLDGEGRLELGLIGKGEGMYYTGGKGMAVTWEKKDANSMTVFYDTEGNEITLNPGNTWFQIMKIGSREKIIS